MVCRQVWGVPTTLMQASWMGERVATVDVSKAISNVLHNKEDAGWGPNAIFRFPTEGGTGAIWQKVAKLLPAANCSYGPNNRMTALDLDERVATFQVRDDYRRVRDAIAIVRVHGLRPEEVGACDGRVRTAGERLCIGTRENRRDVGLLLKRGPRAVSLGSGAAPRAAACARRMVFGCQPAASSRLAAAGASLAAARREGAYADRCGACGRVAGGG